MFENDRPSFPDHDALSVSSYAPDEQSAFSNAEKDEQPVILNLAKEEESAFSNAAQDDQTSFSNVAEDKQPSSLFVLDEHPALSFESFCANIPSQIPGPSFIEDEESGTLTLM